MISPKNKTEDKSYSCVEPIGTVLALSESEYYFHKLISIRISIIIIRKQLFFFFIPFLYTSYLYRMPLYELIAKYIFLYRHGVSSIYKNVCVYSKIVYDFYSAYWCLFRFFLYIALQVSKCKLCFYSNFI